MSQINTDIKDYTIDELFSLLNINIDLNTQYEDVENKINESVDKNIEVFQNIGNDDMVVFFENVRQTLIGDVQNEDTENTTDAQKLLIQSNSSFNAEKNRGVTSNSTDTTNEELFNSNASGNPINRKTITKLLYLLRMIFWRQ